MYDLTTYFTQSLPHMMTRKNIDTVLLSVSADKLSQREWDWIKLMKPMDPPPAMVASAILEHRHETAALSRLQEAGN
jgi:hypothetical protein